MEIEEPVLQGVLLLPPQDMLGKLYKVENNYSSSLYTIFYYLSTTGLNNFNIFILCLSLQKTWQKKYCLLFKRSNCGIERLEVYNNKEDFLAQRPPLEIFTLETCVRIGPSNQPRVITVSKKFFKYKDIVKEII